MKRRRLLKGLAVTSALGAVGYWQASKYWDGYLKNPCLAKLPSMIKDTELWQKIWQDITPSNVWDCHVHTVGMGDADSGIWINPDMQSLAHPLQYAQFQFYLNASCISDISLADNGFVDRLNVLLKDMPEGFKTMLLAFDYHHDSNGQPIKELSTFFVPNEYPALLAKKFSQQFEWVASIHPYRLDALDALDKAKAQGAVAVKWLPPAQNMDPASAKCDKFYQRLAQLKLPLICHAGTEKAVQGSDTQELGNPLRLRRALDNDVKVIVAHCASLGENQDLDKPNLPMTDSFDLFSRMMDEYRENLYGETSAILQINRAPRKIKQLLESSHWHSRLVNGSDYPLPAVMPLISLKRLIRNELLDDKWMQDLNIIREYNGLLFDFAVKRLLQSNGNSFPTSVFETKAIFSS